MTEINPSIFRPADIRGRVNDQELNPSSVKLIGKGYGTFLIRQGINRVVVGYDSRDCSEAFNEAMIEGLLSTGCNVISIGMVLTPMVYWAQHHFQSEGAAMITGSHNPKGWSGFKLARGYNYTIFGSEVKEIQQIIRDEAFILGNGKIEGYYDISELYYRDLLSRSKVGKKFKLIVDCGNGTAGMYAPELLRRAGCEVIELYCDLDTTFPNHFPDPTILETRKDLIKNIAETGADLGLCFDGDGDRLGVNDDQGNTIWADQLLTLWARDILSRHPGAKIVFDIKCSQSLIDEIKKSGGTPVIWITGNNFIKKKCKEEEALLAGEMSGHIFFADRYYGFDDALYAALRLLEYMSTLGAKLSDLIKTLPHYYVTPEIRVDCPDEIKFEIVNDLTQKLKNEGYNVIDIDGARVLFSEGWGLVRASSNLPMLVLRFEAKTSEKLEEYKEIFRKRLCAYQEVSKEWIND